MSPVEFVLVDGIAIGVLVSVEGRRRFCGSTRNLEDYEDLSFGDLDEAQTFFASQLRRAAARKNAEAGQH
ncbi:hypothetical protein F7D14_08000 [Methylocystis parvus]|uniref:Uncharacterized protein n=1 Tax=Methylocystis parvus TaxID=134 RepID=A0A6B8M9M9_9HYPH|nr:hypothetical protein F7D14_08000 [Methylocystis parvus]